MTDVAVQITTLIRNYAPEAGAPSAGTDQEKFLALGVDELGLDSLDRLELVMAIEDHFEITLDEDMVLGCKTVGKLVWLVERTLSREK